MNPSDIWLPDIELFNAKVGDNSSFLGLWSILQEYREFSLATQYRNEPCMALVYPDGEMLWIPPVDIKVTICVDKFKYKYKYKYEHE